MALVLGRMRIAPATFWSMTLPELDALISGATDRSPGDTLSSPTRAGLAALMSRFPDAPRPGPQT